MTQLLPKDEQPLVTVKDYRPSCHSSSSDAPESTDDEFDFEVDKPCPFTDVPKKSRFGKLFFTRNAKGLWGERPIVTTVESPFRLRCWAISGPDELCDERVEGEPFNMDDDVIVPMTGLSLLSSKRGVFHRRRRPKASSGKMSPLQKSHVKVIPPPYPEPPNRSLTVTSRVTRSPGVDVNDMLNTEGRMVEDPPGLSDTSDSESLLSVNYKPSTDSSKSTSINFCLRSEEDSSSEESQADPPSPERSSRLYSEHSRMENIYDSSFLPATAVSNLAQSQAQVQSLTYQVEQLMSLANNLQDQITACNREKIHLQQQIQVLQTTQCSSEESTSPQSSTTETSQETSPRRSSFSKKCFGREEERLRMELLEEKQKSAGIQLENERLLGVIFRLKCEMDLEHCLHERFQKKAVSEQSGGRWQKIREVVRSSSGLWDSRDASKRAAYQRGWPFRRSKSRKQKKTASSLDHSSP